MEKKVVRHGDIEKKEYYKSGTDIVYPDQKKLSDRRSSKKRHNSSRIVKRTDKTGSEDEIAAQITIPEDGGWGWVVVTSSFIILAILNAVQLTFGALLHDIATDLKISKSMTSLISSIAIAVSFAAGPVASALINKFGFRLCSMLGSILTSFSLFICFFLFNYPLLCLFYGFVAGFGNCLMHVTAHLVVGFYFEKLRSIAMSIASSGSSVGVIIMGPVNSIIVDKCGWRVVTMLEAGLVGFVYFLSMTYLPLLSFSVVPTVEEHEDTLVTQLPSLMKLPREPSELRSKATLLERRLQALSNHNFPTALDVVDEIESPPPLSPGPSRIAVSKLTLVPRNPFGEISQKQINTIRAYMSRTNVSGRKRNSISIKEVDFTPPPKEKKRCCGFCCSWEKDDVESRPIYRDDAFYEGSIQRLPVYQKSRANIPQDELTGLEYQMAVSRAALTSDLKERKMKIFSTAIRRVLVTMMDPMLLKRISFIILSLSGTVVYLGFLVPYIYIQDRTVEEGLHPDHCKFFLSTMSVASLIGRLLLGFIVSKFDTMLVYIIFEIVCGLSVIGFNFSFNIYYQHSMSFLFGFFNSGISSLRSILLVDLYGLEKLTNGTGLNLLFCGVGTLLGPPLASYLKSWYNYNLTFYFAGSVIIFAGLMLIPVKSLCKLEDRKSSKIGFGWRAS